MAILKIRDENGKVHEIAALRGEKGADGTVAFESLTDNQKASLKGEKGDKGDKGDAGYTPQKGIDYYTEADKEELIEQIVVPVDQEFNTESTNAIANRIVYAKFINHEQEIIANGSYIGAVGERVAAVEERMDAQEQYMLSLSNTDLDLHTRLESVEGQLGNAETALDGIIAIQESLIGGETA